MKNYFYALKEEIFKHLNQAETANLYFRSERSDFTRLNHAKIRQIGTVEQAYVTFKLFYENKQVTYQWVCGENPQEDARVLLKKMPQMREAFSVLPEDPYCIAYEGAEQKSIEDEQEIMKMEAVVEQVCDSADGEDLVGFYAAGPQWFGYANSQGAFKWMGRSSWVFDYSLYLQADKAVKTSIAGTQWSATSWQASLQAQKEQLAYMHESPMDLSPGDYRVYLAPAAVAEILSLMCWGGFSKRSKEEKRSPLQYLYEGKKELSPQVSLVENTQTGIGPFFNASGFDRPLQTHLVKQGKAQDLLTSPRSAQKYKCDTNGADEDEGPLSLQMAPGELSEAAVLENLGTGLYINNLWYLNFSDRIAGRMTGMTRFGCFWVENGKIQRPINVLRFDDSIYDILGTHLEALTRDAAVQISADTYGSRSVDCMENPGALVACMKFTL